MQTYDFSNWKPRAHYLGLLMGAPDRKSNAVLLEEAKQSLREKLAEEDTHTKHETKKYERLVESIDKLRYETIPYLKTVVDVPNLPVTCQSKLFEVFTSVTEGVTKDISSKYLMKGLDVEEDSLTQTSLYFLEKGELVKPYNKNCERMENEYTSGECDSLDEDTVIDTKSSWDIFSFDAKRFKKIDPIYEWQAQDYMWLYNKKNALVVFNLLDTPEYLIQSEERKLRYELFGSNDVPEDQEKKYEEVCFELRKKHVHTHRPITRRVLPFRLKRNDDMIDQIKERVPECRKLLSNIEILK